MRLLAIAALSGTVVTPAAGQEHSGRIDVVVREDAGGKPLEKVSLEAAGLRTVAAVTDEYGEAHFVDLAPGEYTVAATLRGYNDYYSINVPVSAGTTVPLRIWMSVQGPVRQVDARIDAPVMDVRAHTDSTTIKFEELQRVPWTRDAGTVLQTVPAVVLDRMNVGGAESGQQPVFAVKGAGIDDTVWAIDGVPATDMSAPSRLAAGVDFGMLREMRVTTGGASPYIASPGAQANVVLQSGGNEWRGSGRAYFGHRRFQSKNIANSIRPELDSFSRAGDYSDFGVEGGGPVRDDRVFGWAAAGRTRPERRIFRSGPSDELDVETARDTTTQRSYAAKLDATIDPRTRAGFTYLRTSKDEAGYGAGPFRFDDTTQDEDGSSSFYKAAMDWRAGPDLFLSGRYAHIASSFSLAPRLRSEPFSTDRPQDYAALNGYWFRRVHQFSFGFGWRQAADRPSPIPDSKGKYWSAYASDTLVLRRMTVDVAARWDRAASAAGNADIVRTSVTPRIGVTYLADDEGRTLLRGSYSILPAQLQANAAAAVTSRLSYDGRHYSFRDRDGAIGDYGTPLTHEVVFGGDRHLQSGISLTALATWRRTTGFNWLHYRGVTADEFVPIGHLTGNVAPIGPFDVPLYRADPRVATRGLDLVYDKREGYRQRYWGVEIIAGKRLSNNWSMRLAFTTNDHREYFDGPDAIADPTAMLESPNHDGGPVMRLPGSSGAPGVFMLPPKYQLAGTLSYQTPFGFDMGVAYTMRQGHAMPFHMSGVAPDALNPDGRNVLLTGDLADARLSPAHSLDGRISKAFSTSGVHLYTVHLDLDIFNIANRAVVLERGYDLARPGFNRVLGVMNPRTARAGVRVTF